ncbi:MAG TPA: endonuclease/exonuclease/phosphatase family protein [Bacillota bacterium]
MKGSAGTLKLTVLSLNLHAGINWLGHYDLEGMFTVLQEINPDLCGFQEVDCQWSRRSRFQNIPTIFTQRLGMAAQFAAALNNNTGSFGNLILSKYPVINRWSQQLPDQSEQRCFACVQLWVSGVSLLFLTTHLGLAENDRRRQVELIRLFLSRYPGPKLLTGDLNASPESEAVQNLTAGFQDLQKSSNYCNQGTLRLKNGRIGPRIDYILATPEFYLEDFQVIDSLISDHLPLVAKLRLQCKAAKILTQPVYYQPMQL